MKNTVLTALFVLMLAAPVAADVRPSALSPSSSEKAALAELLSARIKAALKGEEYSLDKTCDSEGDCTISIRP